MYKKLLFLLFILLAFVVSDAFAKSRSYSSKSYSSKSYSNKSYSNKFTKSWGSKKVPTATKKSTASFGVKKKTTKKWNSNKATSSKNNKNVAKSTSKTDKAQMKRQSSKAKKKYATRADATKAVKATAHKKNTSYTSSTPPKIRPASVPKTVTRNGRQTTVVYHQVSGGGYGYGYIDPLTNMFMTLAVADMIANTRTVDRYEQQTYYPPQTKSPKNDFSIFFFITTVILCVALLFCIFRMRANHKEKD